ncbi:hypothetical protein B0H63DRAFT_111759 [Podospora didyma]|uniref:2EXR domain-containing protein n=1 Tax=Podospora didyma TaxID=330526 RepID=A0AAE0NZ26_9PEZI|nr:hypothetical protein B0H63DRAFT_111759 [Podospora didyma]
MPAKCQTFHLFSLLPTELRLEIWRQKCLPRVVQVRYDQENDRCLSTTRPPMVLQICRESRHEALRLYVKIFGTRSHAGDIYFLPGRDVLYLPRCGGMGYGDTAREFSKNVIGTVEHVHSLAIDHVKPEIRRPWETYSKLCLMRNFPNLDETFLILSTSTNDSNRRQGQDSEQIEFVDPGGDHQAISQLMDNVKSSFIYELDSEAENCDDDEDSPQLHLELIPKRKIPKAKRTTTPHLQNQPPPPMRYV